VKLLYLSDLTAADGPLTAVGDMLGVQISQGVVRAAVVEGGAVQSRVERVLAPDARPDEVMDAVVATAQSVSASPTAVGLAVPGEVDSSGRCWGLRGVLGFDGVYIAEEVAARLGCPVAIESDGSAAALAERTQGRAKGFDSSLTLLVGSRLAGGLVLGGGLRRGSSGFGLAVSHLRIDTSPEARACECGRRGCLGAYVSFSAAPSPEELASAGAAIGAGLSLLQNILDLDAAILICERPDTFRALEPELRQALRQQVFGPPAGELPLLQSQLGQDAVLIGAATLALQIGAPPASR
jgi:predicted NBD/HSP70 family sugar kinase